MVRSSAYVGVGAVFSSVTSAVRCLAVLGQRHRVRAPPRCAFALSRARGHAASMLRAGAQMDGLRSYLSLRASSTCLSSPSLHSLLNVFTVAHLHAHARGAPRRTGRSRSSPKCVTLLHSQTKNYNAAVGLTVVFSRIVRSRVVILPVLGTR